MCGIIGYTGAREAAPLLLEGLRRLEYRGYDSAGVAVIDPGRDPIMALTRAVGKIDQLARRIAEAPLSGRSGIGHTRWATHGKPSEPNAHPHRHGRVSVVHNGIIENYAELRARLEADGHHFASETDTEVIAHLVEREYHKHSDLHAAVKRVLHDLQGAWALCVVADDRPGEIVVARHHSPLLIGLHQESAHPEPEMFVASDVAAILQHTRQVLDLDDGDTARLTAESVEVHDLAGEPVKRRPRRIDWSPIAAEKQGFKHFMLKEINEQPRAIRATLMGHLNGDIKFNELALDDLDPHARVLMLGCGTSWHAGMAGKYLIERLARLPCEVDISSEFRYREPIVRPGDLAIAISQSGETADTLAALREAKRQGARSLAICNVVDSTIAREADQVLYTHAGPEISVASTKAFTTQLTMLTMLAVHLGRQRGTIDPERAHEIVEGLRSMPVAIDGVLGQSAHVKTVARRYAHARDVLFLGRGLAFPVALEGALKLKEISYVHAEGYASGEMKHGPIALIDDEVPVIVLALKGPGYDKALANLEEVRSREGKVIAIASLHDERIGDLADDVILLPDVDEYLQPILATVPLQLFAYYVADLKGTDVDQPRNLAKSVTVE